MIRQYNATKNPSVGMFCLVMLIDNHWRGLRKEKPSQAAWKGHIERYVGGYWKQDTVLRQSYANAHEDFPVHTLDPG